MAAQQITESEVRRLTQELHAKDAELRAKDVELRELKEERSAMLLRYVREFTELQKRQASTTKMLEASAALLQKAGDTIGRQGSRLERERADRDEVQDRLSHLVNQVATHVLRLRDAYRRASATMPAVGLNPFDHPVDFNELRLPDLVSFFTYISEELSRLRAMVGAELDKEGLHAAVAVAGRTLSGLRHRNPFVPLDAVFDELAPMTRSGLCGRLHPASPTSCASRSRGTSVVFRRPLHGHVHVSAQHDRWIKLRRCRSVTVAQSVWVCLVAFSSQYSCFLFVYFCQPTSVDSCTLHALCQTPKSGSRRELLLPSRAPFIHPA